ncbi:hypothetical protein HSBAA_45030 [Vreelandella sulfidaeris]|uniref:Carboxylesterase type B domain-containing protein n=1 Tax=Vreelandella sulfidaeris TaxID=115553 RepID=A0A455UC60_9GAMM|nr:hypothetical protein HSBAA_45030 [Halomonas sulfidaeris]
MRSRLHAAHAKAKGNAYVYRLDWGKGRYPFGAAHTIELPLLLAEPANWQYADLVKTWTTPPCLSTASACVPYGPILQEMGSYRPPASLNRK